MAQSNVGPILDEHGSGANTSEGDGDDHTGGSMAAGSTDGSFEHVLPQNYTGPPGLTEEQRAEFERARQIPELWPNVRNVAKR